VRERAYRFLLRLLPRGFRERFSAEILDTARQASQRTRGRPSALVVLTDLLATVVLVRVDALRAALRVRTHPGSPVSSLFQDARFALRALLRDPLFTAFSVITLGLGIGAGVTMFAVVDRLLLRGPDHVVDPDRVVRVYFSHEPAGMRRFTSSGVGHVTYELVRSRVRAFDQLASYATNGSRIGHGADARAARVTYASGTFFGLLGVQPILGRFFGPEDDDPARPDRPVVLSHAIWQRDFAGSPEVLGRTLVVEDQPHTIVGVAPAGFTGAELRPVELWLPMSLLSPRVTQDWATTWDALWMSVIGRLAADVSAEAAGAELTDAFRAGYGGDEPSMRAANLFVAPLGAGDAGTQTAEARVARWLLGVSALLLLAVCANLVNLLIARDMRRVRDLSVRLALGASAARVQRLLVAEALALALGGAACALAVAQLLGGLARRLLADVQWSSPPVDARLLAVAAVTALALGLVMGLVPAARAVSLARSSAAGLGGTRDGGARQGPLRASLAVTQAALSVLLLIGAGLFSRSLVNALSTDLGIEPEEVLVVELSRGTLAAFPPDQVEGERARRRVFPLEALESLRAIPEVTHAAVAVGMPFGNRFSVRLWIPGLDSIPRLSTGGPSISAVSDEYFATVGTSILRGRAFRRGEGAGTERVAIVSETMARTVWPGEDAIGKCLIAMSDTLPCATVVGVAADARRGALREEPSMHYYIPAGQEVGFGGAVLLLEGEDTPLALAPDVRRVLAALDGTITYVELGTIQERIDPQLRPWRLGTAVLASAGVLALITMLVGVYSITSYLLSLRTREIAVRVSLGATALHLARLVMGGSADTTLVGASTGVALALGAGRFVAPLLFDVSPRDPLVFGGAVGGLLLTALLASAPPCAKAARIDPNEALRAE
jgi:predicted permease